MRSTAITRYVAWLLLIMLQQGINQPVSGQAIEQLLELNKPVGRALHADESHAYPVALQRKQVINIKLTRQGTDATIRVTDAMGRTVPRLSTTTNEYDEELSSFQVPRAGRYTIHVRAARNAAPNGYYTLELNEVISGEEYAARVAEARRKQVAVVNWLTTHAVPLATLSVDSNWTDLAPLKEILRDVRIVGLGEQAHGAHEFFQAKHRLLDWLVREMGFRVFVMEGSYAGWQQINDYVAGRTEEVDKALAEQGFWAWNTEDMKAVIDWARQYNKTVSVAEQLRFVGIDPQYNQPGKDKLLAYLKRVAPERVPSTQVLFALDLDSLQSVRTETGSGSPAQEALKKAQAGYKELLAFLDSASSNVTEPAGRSECDQMREYARVLTQYIAAYDQTDSTGVATRDWFMADNCRRLIEREPAGTRFVIWGHNGHVATGGNSLFKPLGAYLREFYGNGYYALGTSFNKGTFLAREAPATDSTRQWLKTFTAKPAPEQSVDWYLAQTGLKKFVVDFRAAPQQSGIQNWLAEPLLMRSIGSVYRPSFAAAYFYPTQLAERFDGLLFVDTITRASPTTSVKDVASWEH